MFKKENRIWWYLLGCVLLFALFLWLVKDYMLPVLTGRRGVIEEVPFTYAQAPEMLIDVNRGYKLKFTTNLGSFIVELYPSSAPQNVNNLVFLSQEGYYNGTSFFRLIPDLLIQSGDRNTLDDDPNNDGLGGPGYLIKDEMNWESLQVSETQKSALATAGYQNDSTVSSHSLEKYSMAMASAGAGTNGSQFFFILAGSEDTRLAEMQGFFTVVGKVVEGSLTLDSMNAVSSIQEDEISRPATEIIVEKVEVLIY